MDIHPDALVFRYIREHAPVAIVVIRAGLDLDGATIERALTTLLDADMIVIAGYAPTGDALYAPLNA